MAPPNDDPFDDLLTLEDTLYTTAHNQGIADGARAGRIEGRIFGLEKGFEKFAALGELHGRGAVWGARISAQAAEPTSTTIATSSLTQPGIPSIELEKDPSGRSPVTSPQLKAKITKQLPQIHHKSTRLQSNISLLYHLTDPPTFSTSNTEVDVGDFDDRFKRAGAKAKVIERIIGETSTTGVQTSTTKNSKSAEEDNKSGTGKARNVRLEGEGKKGGKKWDDSMEDFGGSRLIK